MFFKVFIVFGLIITGFECSRILFLYPTISKSHILPLQSISIALAEKGHDITFVSTYPLSKQVKNYRDIKVPFDEADKEFLNEVIKDPKKGSDISVFMKLFDLIYGVGNETLQMKEMRQMMDEEKFDLVIVGWFMTEFMLGVADHFKCPSILFSPSSIFGTLSQAVGNPLGTSGTPHPWVQVDKMDFIARLKVFLAQIGELAMVEYTKYRARQVYNFNFPQDRYRSYDQSLRNVSLVLTNSHFTSAHPRPNLPNVIEIGGVQVKPKPLPLPEDIKSFLDDAKNGAILFSLGSNAKSTYLSKEVISVLLKVFSGLKQRVVMKWEANTLDGKPDNVFISKWLPQDDVLAHPNIKLFISHCGFGGVVEAKYHAVPIVGLPLYADQITNAGNIEKDGWGKHLDLSSLTEKALTSAITDVLGNPTYYKTVKKFSDLTRDRPMNAQDTAVFWVEYVLRHHGAPHMHYPGADLNFLQYNSIDVIAFLIFVVYAAFKLIAYGFKKICCRRQQQKSKQKTN